MVTVTVEGADGARATVYERFPGNVREPTLFLAREGWVEGWYSSPDLKVESHARQTGHGNFTTPGDRVLYESRTVTVHLTCWGGSREAAVALAKTLSRALCQRVTLTVDDGGEPTFATGYCQLAWEGDYSRAGLAGTLTVVCDDPRRYGTARSATLAPEAPSGGLTFHADGGRGLVFPISFGDGAPSFQRAVLHNGGTAPAYPVLRCSGVEAGFSVLDAATGRGVTCAATGGWQPVVLDCLSRTATVAGVDVTRDLTRRDFFSVPPGGTLALALHGTARGSVTAEWHDTYI